MVCVDYDGKIFYETLDEEPPLPEYNILTMAYKTTPFFKR